MSPKRTNLSRAAKAFFSNRRAEQAARHTTPPGMPCSGRDVRGRRRKAAAARRRQRGRAAGEAERGGILVPPAPRPVSGRHLVREEVAALRCAEERRSRLPLPPSLRRPAAAAPCLPRVPSPPRPRSRRWVAGSPAEERKEARGDSPASIRPLRRSGDAAAGPLVPQPGEPRGPPRPFRRPLPDSAALLAATPQRSGPGRGGRGPGPAAGAAPCRGPERPGGARALPPAAGGGRRRRSGPTILAAALGEFVFFGKWSALRGPGRAPGAATLPRPAPRSAGARGERMSARSPKIGHNPVAKLLFHF